MRVLRRYAWMIAAVVAALVVDRAASAQSSTITVNTVGITRSNSSHPNSLSPNAISREDCVNDDKISIPLTLSPPGTLTLQAWVSNLSDCTVKENRSGSAPTCGQVYQNAMPTVTQTVTLRVQDIIRALNNPGTDSSGKGSVADCTTSLQGNTAPQELDIYFTYMAGATTVDSFALLKTQFALLGPNAPDGFSVGPGNTFLRLSWNVSSNTSTYGYYFYCDPPPGSEIPGWVVADAAATGAGGASGTGGGSASTCDASTGDSGDDAATDAAATDAACTPSSSDSGSSGSGGSSGGSGACNSSGILEPGVTPDSTLDNFRCGQVAGRTASTGIVGGLINDYPYLVAVAGYDSLGNIGAMTAPACEAPGKTNDFFTVYRDFGGNAGDSSFCSVSGVGRRAPGDASYLLAVGLTVVSSRWRRRADRRNKQIRCTGADPRKLS